MSPDFKGTTSRRAIIVGMTNTDQVGMLQAGPATAEVLPDVDTGGAADGGEEINEATGLTAEQQAIFDSMRTGDVPASDPDAGDGDAGEGGEDPDAAGDTGAEAGADLASPDDGATRKQGEPAEADGRGQKGPPKTVNYSKYQRELKKANDRAAELERTAAAERENRIKLAARVELINEALAGQRQAAEQAAAAAQADPNAPPANPFEEEDIDPNENYAEAVAQLNRRNRFMYEQQQQFQTTTQETNADREMRETFERDFRSYAGTEQGKDLPQAYQFLKDSRLTEICITKFDKDPNDPNEVFTPAEVQEMVNLFNQEEKWVVSNALKAGKSPAQAILKLARSRGFKPAAAAAAPAPKPATARNGAAAPATARPAVPAVPAPAPAPAAGDAAAALAQLRQNQEDGRSLSDGGGVPPGGLSAEMLLRMNDAEFGELLDTLSEHQLQALMGRDFPGGR